MTTTNSILASQSAGQTNSAQSVTSSAVITSSGVPTDIADITPISTYIFVGLAVTVLFLAIYYAYGKFIENSQMTDSDIPQDKPVSNFDLNIAIDELEKIQRNVLSKLSSDVGI